MNLIDPGNEGTWPPDVQAHVAHLAARCRRVESNRRTTPCHELRLEHIDAGHEAEADFREMLGDRRIALFHATRLLPNEVDAVRTEGLLVLDERHRCMRLEQVVALYGDEIGANRLERLRDAGPLHWDDEHRRARLGKLWGVTPLTAFEDDGDGILPVLENWGGEAFFWAAKEGDPTLAATIRALTERSSPFIVEAAVQASMLNSYTWLWPIFVGQLDGREDAWHEFYTEKSLPPEHVFSILDPSSERWPLPADAM